MRVEGKEEHLGWALGWRCRFIARVVVVDCGMVRKEWESGMRGNLNTQRRVTNECNSSLTKAEALNFQQHSFITTSLFSSFPLCFPFFSHKYPHTSKAHLCSPHCSRRILSGSKPDEELKGGGRRRVSLACRAAASEHQGPRAGPTDGHPRGSRGSIPTRMPATLLSERRPGAV